MEDNIKIDLKQIGHRSVEWIRLAQYRNQRQALVSIIMILRFYKRLGISWLAEQVSASQEGPMFKQLVSAV
jgi:hypothetical protein